jgi:hypothetical protein
VVDMWRSTIPSIVVLGLLIVTAILLIAGYGVPVGIGFTAGLVLGAIAAASVLFWLKAGSPGSRSVSVGGMSYFHADAPPNVETMERYGRAMSRVAAVDQSPLRRVVGVGQAVITRSVRVELIALELRESGGILTVAVESPPPNPSAGSYGEVTITDDHGTQYVAAITGGGMSSPGSSRSEIRFAPAPPDAARTLVVRIDSFVEPFAIASGAAERLDGPWEFRVTLG